MTTPAPAVPVLPPLPKPGSVSVVNADPGCVELRNNYTVTQMHAYAIEYAAALEASSPAGLVDAAELKRLRALINTPHTDDWIKAVELEAAHQQERWGAEHNGGKAAQDWFWLLGWLSGKAVAAFVRGDHQKGLHHIVSSGAVLLNWHRNVTGQNTGMRPGIPDPDAAILAATPAGSAVSGGRVES